MDYNQVSAIVNFPGSKMSEEQALDLLDQCRSTLNPDEFDCLEFDALFANSPIYGHLRQHAAETGR